MSEVAEMPPISEPTMRSQGFLDRWRQSFVGGAVAKISDVVLGMFHASGNNPSSQ